VILVPTRELCSQVLAESAPYLREQNINAVSIFGGQPKGPMITQLRQGPQMLVATPGRLIDMITAQATHLRNCTYFVLDEADRMLDMGFEKQLRLIMTQVRPDRQILMWSATWPKEVQALSRDYIRDPVTIHIGSTELRANPNVTQHIHMVNDHDKPKTFHELLKGIMSVTQKPRILVFTATKDRADRLTLDLHLAGLKNVGVIHGGKEQNQRIAALNHFKTGSSSILVATDVAARGLDVSDITHVINFDFPKVIEDYIHRIGRTGRAGKKGISHSFFTPADSFMVPKLVSIFKETNHDVPPQLMQVYQGSNRYH